MCKILGKNPERVHDSDITNYLTEKAERDPEAIINLYTGGDTHLRLLFVDARERGLITVKDRLYLYGDILLGATDESVIMYFKDPRNKKVVESLKRQLDPEFFTEEDDLEDIIIERHAPIVDDNDKPTNKKVSTKK